MNPLLSRTLWAALALLGLVSTSAGGVVIGAVGSGILLISVIVFLALQPFFPTRFHRLLIYLILLAGGVPLLRFFLPSAGPSVFFLLPAILLLAQPELFRKRKNPLKIIERNLLAACAFWLLVAFHGIFLEGMRSIQISPLPAGSYLLLGFLAALLPRGMKP